jgi:hypothetical protein
MVIPLLRSEVLSERRLPSNWSILCYDRQSVSLSANTAPIWGLRPDFYYCQTVAGLLMWGALSIEMTDVSFTVTAGPRQRSHSQIRVPWDSRPYFLLSQSWDFPFLRLLRLTGLRWRYSTLPPHEIELFLLQMFALNPFALAEQKTLFPLIPLLLHAFPLSWESFAEPLPRNGFTRYSMYIIILFAETKCKRCVRIEFDILTAMTVKCSVSWNVKLCGLIEVHWHFAHIWNWRLR